MGSKPVPHHRKRIETLVTFHSPILPNADKDPKGITLEDFKVGPPPTARLLQTLHAYQPLVSALHAC